MSSIFYFVYVVVLLFGIIQMPKLVTARFCEGGHICSLPRECCTQGCCPPYQSGPRQLPPPSEHVLNLFFISHWFFWCVVVALILAILCAYSLWKKRRTLCGWGFPEHHPQSEGDSAGSCYAPPQYSRCNSFHHPPPPYTEVTSKPDLYPLVFTCNSDNGKNGSSYLMVQYFRNYIVRPAGSLSAASTVDSLSSSFICNANEANTLVPPPYSRAASPEIGFSSHHFPHTQYMMPRSASQLVCAGGQQDINGISNIATQQVYQHQGRTPQYTVVAINGATGGGVGNHSTSASPYNTHLRTSESGNLNLNLNDDSGESCRSGSVVSGNNSARDHCGRLVGFIQSQSDQHFRYIANSNSSISDIFVSNSCNVVTSGGITNDTDTTTGQNTTAVAAAMVKHPQSGGTPVIYSNGCIIKPNPLHRANTNPTQIATESSSNKDPVYNSCNSIAEISLAVPVLANRTETEFRDLHMLRRSLETCCQILQPQNVQSTSSFTNGGDSPLRMHELTKKYADEALRSYVTSGTCSGVSSLANIGTPSSPPQATSPTGEVKEILDQIRQLQADTSYEDIMQLNKQRPTLHRTMPSPSPTNIMCHSTDSHHSQLQSYATMSEQANSISATSPTNSGTTDVTIRSPVSPNSSLISHKLSMSSLCSKPTSSPNVTSTSKRPSTLQQTKKKFYSPKPNKAMYIPMTANPSAASSNRCILKSPVSSVVGANFFANRGRVRKIWISRSAPTTPGTSLPPNRLGDDSPLLNEHEEDPEGEQNEEMD